MEQKSAVDCGYWHLWRYDPRLEEEGRNPFQLDSKEPDWSKFKDFLLGEVRYTQLIKSFPKQADELFEAAKESAQWRYRSYQRMAAAQFGDMPTSEVAVAAEGEN
jgi:pyruvate-ferredoxin/flavodoxin oxidoreductase